MLLLFSKKFPHSDGLLNSWKSTGKRRSTIWRSGGYPGSDNTTLVFHCLITCSPWKWSSPHRCKNCFIVKMKCFKACALIILPTYQPIARLIFTFTKIQNLNFQQPIRILSWLAGTGIAPFRAFIEDEMPTEASGRQLVILWRSTFRINFLYKQKSRTTYNLAH